VGRTATAGLGKYCVATARQKTWQDHYDCKSIIDTRMQYMQWRILGRKAHWAMPSPLA